MTTAVARNRESQTQVTVLKCCKRAVRLEAIWHKNIHQLQGRMEICYMNKSHQCSGTTQQRNK